MKHVLTLVAAAALLPGSAQAASFFNGSFESGSGSDPFLQLNAPSSAIDGWTVGGNSIDYIFSYWNASDGTRSIDLSGSDAGSVSQTFDTVDGRRYRVSYDIAGNPDAGPATKTLSVLATGGVLDTQSFTNTPTTTRSAMGWQQRFYDFTANGASTTLTFSSLTGGAYGAALDNVSVSLAGAVPEPATWAMMIGGMGMVGGALRRRARPARALA